MSTPFKPELATKEAALKSRMFVKENKHVFWDVFKPLIPYFMGLILLDLILKALFPEVMFFYIDSYAYVYFMICLMVSWSRVVLHGAHAYESLNPFKPDKYVLRYFKFIFLCMVGFDLVMRYMMVLFPSGAPMIVVHLILLAGQICIFFKIIFYLPAMATRKDIRMKDCMAMARGYYGKVFISLIKASWRIWMIVFVLFFVVSMLSSLVVVLELLLGNSGQEAKETAMFVSNAILTLPMLLYFTPILTVLGVTVLSNYYQHALQNRFEADTPDEE